MEESRDYLNQRIFGRSPPGTNSYKHPVMSTSLYPLASLAQIEKSPSRDDGIPREIEEDLRAYGCKLIHQAGILLKQWVICGPSYIT